MLTDDSDGLANVVLKEQWTYEVARSTSTPNSDFFVMLLYLVWIDIVSNLTILFVHLPEMDIITEDDFSMKIRVSCYQLQSPFSGHTVI